MNTKNTHKSAWQWFWRGFFIIGLVTFVALAVPGPRPDTSSRAYEALGLARDYVFDFAAWEVEALTHKTTLAALAPQSTMTEEERTAFVRSYLERITTIQQLEREIVTIYTDPAISDADTASGELRAERDRLRAQQQEQQALAEAIIQSHIAEMLRDEEFGTLGQIMPPVAMRFTQLPSVLIISEREQINRVGSYALDHGITVDEMEVLEQTIDSELGVSSLVVPIGGLAVWPSMIIESGNLPFVYDVGAHEWFHHYLAFYPLGFNYGRTPDLFTMNETAASIVGREIGWLVLDRYYPDLAGPPPDWTPLPPPDPSTPPTPADPDIFDFRAEMRETRVRVDELLAAGQVEEAEQYMEAQREIFVANGYLIRKLNQAYFSFYGSYADTPGATGSDPVGPMVRELRYYSPTLYDFAVTMRGITTVEQLETALQRARSQAEAIR